MLIVRESVFPKEEHTDWLSNAKLSVMNRHQLEIGVSTPLPYFSHFHITLKTLNLYHVSVQLRMHILDITFYLSKMNMWISLDEFI